MNIRLLHLVAAFLRRALQRSRATSSGVGHQGNGMYPPGVIAAALGALRVAGRVLTEAERAGTVPETCAEILPLLMARSSSTCHPYIIRSSTCHYFIIR